MTPEQYKKRDSLIIIFQKAQDVASVTIDKSLTIDLTFHQSLCDLVNKFGYDGDTQGHIMMALDSLLDSRSIDTVRQYTRDLANHVAEIRERMDDKHGDEYKGLETFESRLAAQWKHLLLADQQTNSSYRAREMFQVRDHAFSPALRAAALSLKSVNLHNPDYRLRPQ